MKLVGLSRNFSRPSRTRCPAGSNAAEAGRKGQETSVFALVDVGSKLAPATLKSGFGVNFDALVVGSAAYKESYSGLLKHEFDIFEQDVFRNKPIILAATAKCSAACAHDQPPADSALRIHSSCNDANLAVCN